MRVMVLVKATEGSEAALPIDPVLLAQMRAFNESLAEAGVLIEGDGLRATRHGVRIAFEGAKRTVIEGPFTPAREQVAGYWIWEVKDMAEALAWGRRCPNPMPVPSEIEIRPFMTLADIEMR